MIDESESINCKLCEKTCPNMTAPIKNSPIEWKQGWAHDYIRNESTSGGAASAIMQSFITMGGYVASCLFKDGEFCFDVTNYLEYAKRFAGSKYVKSNPAGIYERINSFLKTNKVLFVGLPCQVAALKNYLSHQDNLYTIDLICHGTPSFEVLAKFLEENHYGIKELDDIKFRRKCGTEASFEQDRSVLSKAMDEYICSFLQSINYTENCYSCNFASLARVSDVTLGDSWGTELSTEERDGISLVLCQTKKGQELVRSASLILKDVDLDNAVRNNHQLVHPSLKTGKRDKFLNMLKSGKNIQSSNFFVHSLNVYQAENKTVIDKSRFHEKWRIWNNSI